MSLMLGTGVLFFSATALFIILSILFTFEENRGNRFVLEKFRTRLDGWLDKIIATVFFRLRYLIRHIIKLSWYYSLHSTLKTVLTALVSLYDNLEAVFNRNRERARVLRAERRAIKSNHNNLSKIATYKEMNALSPEEKKRLREKKLERD